MGDLRNYGAGFPGSSPHPIRPTCAPLLSDPPTCHSVFCCALLFSLLGRRYISGSHRKSRWTKRVDRRNGPNHKMSPRGRILVSEAGKRIGAFLFPYSAQQWQMVMTHPLSVVHTLGPQRTLSPIEEVPSHGPEASLVSPVALLPFCPNLQASLSRSPLPKCYLPSHPPLTRLC